MSAMNHGILPESRGRRSVMQPIRKDDLGDSMKPALSPAAKHKHSNAAPASSSRVATAQ